MSAAEALAQSKNPQVRAFATRMIIDQDQTTKALQRAVAAAGVAPPPMGDGARAGMLAALGALIDPAFDHAYWQQQALAHRSALIAGEGYAANGDNVPLRDVAKAAIPVVRQYLDIAEEMATQHG